MNALELLDTYKRLGYQNFAPTNLAWAEVYLDNNKMMQTCTDLKYAANMFKTWVEDNNAFDSGDFIH